ncbi:MAG: ImmA/IrrE family metallo-endopeptidase [Clostridia bacterium]|nr:ImmA/IrrE family metallo-endopeptidase [Clostridia bacterium]
MAYSRKAAEEKRQAEVERLRQMLSEGIREYLTDANYLKYLKTVAKFYQYSARNALLITMQNPDATAVASYMDWKIKFHRHVKPGEHGIRIIAPIRRRREEEQDEEKSEGRVCGFRAATIFDVSQTEGEPLPDIVQELTGSVPDFDRLLEAACGLTRFEIVAEKTPPDVLGTCLFHKRRIVISPDLSEAMTIKTIIHEIAHARLHGGTPLLPREIREMQAESVAWIVCAHLGIDAGSYSYGYLISWGAVDKPEFFEKAMPAVVSTAADLIRGFDEGLKSASLLERQSL